MPKNRKHQPPLKKDFLRVFFFCFFFHFLKIECEIADKQLEKLEQIAMLPMSSVESKTIKPLIATMDNLLREWISADKDVKGDTYALKKMMVQFSLFILFCHQFHLLLAYLLSVLIFYSRMNGKRTDRECIV